MALSKGPRECTRCGSTKPQDQFSTHGVICHECKIAAVNTLEERRRKMHKKYEQKKLAQPRTCTRCGATKQPDQFSLYGIICSACKSSYKKTQRRNNGRQMRSARIRAAKSVGGETKFPARVYLMGRLL